MTVNYTAVSGYGIEVLSFDHVKKILNIDPQDYESWSSYEVVEELVHRLRKLYPSMKIDSVYIGNPYVYDAKESVLLAVNVTSASTGTWHPMNCRDTELTEFKDLLQKLGFYQQPNWFVGNQIG